MSAVRPELSIERQARDRWRLIVIDAMLAGLLDMLAPVVGPLETPNMRWHPGDVVDDLTVHRERIKRERARLDQ